MQLFSAVMGDSSSFNTRVRFGFQGSVLMAAGALADDATVSFSFTFVTLTMTSTVTAMATVPAVTEQVHPDEEYENQNPEPICQ